MSLQFLQQADGWFWSLSLVTIFIFFWIITAIMDERKLMGLIIIRVFVFIVLLFMLLQPKFSWKDHYQFPQRWNIYADRSVSMGYHQSLSPNSYINNVNIYFDSALNNDKETQNYYFDFKVYNADEQSFKLDGEATDLSKVIDHIKAAESELVGAIIISDGQITKGESEQSQLSKLSIPIYTIGVGDSIPMVDIAIQTISAPTVVIKGEEMDISVTISSYGRVDDRVNVLLYRGKKLLGSKYIQLQGGGSLNNAKFRITPQTLGKNNYSVKTSVLADEINIKNNSQKFHITVLKDRYKIALITGSPNFNTIPLKKVIKSIPRVEYDHYIQKGDKFIPSINEFWSTSYELIIFDNFPITPISNKWQKILAKKLVSQKSSLFLVAGPNTDKNSVESIFPFFHVKTSKNIIEYNKRKQWYWIGDNNIITEFISFEFDSNSNNNVFPPLFPKIFIETDENISNLAYFKKSTTALLVAGEVDGLRSGIWTSSDFSTLYYKMTETDYEDISVSLLHNLFSWFLRTSGENELYFRVNKSIFQQGEEIYITGSHFNNKSNNITSITGSILLSDDKNQTNTYELNYNPVNDQWETRFLAGKPGSYTFEINLENESDNYTQQGSLIIDESQIELNQVSLNNKILEFISSHTNGRYLQWESRADLIENIKPELKQEIIVKNARLNENIYSLSLLILLISIEWYIRRRIGLS